MLNKSVFPENVIYVTIKSRGEIKQRKTNEQRPVINNWGK